MSKRTKRHGTEVERELRSDESSDVSRARETGEETLRASVGAQLGTTSREAPSEADETNADSDIAPEPDAHPDYHRSGER